MLKKRNLIFLSLLILGVLLISGCWLISTPTHTVTYDGNGHTGGSVPIDSTVYKENDTVTVLDKGDLVKTGYTFAGWNTAADGSGTDHAVGSTFTMGAADVTLYAKWATNTYTVTFNSQGGSAVSSQTVEHGGKVTKPTNPTRTGYTFGGWYKESGCTNAWVFATDTVTANVTLYAKWTINSYTVTYDGNVHTAGTVPVDPSSPYEYGATVTVLNKGDLVKTGYTFDGWNTAADGNGTDQAEGSTFAMGASDVTLYAKWAAVIDIAAIPGVTAPVTGATPVTTITATAQYTGTVTWSPNDSTFAGTTVYTATITLTAKPGFTLTGVTENFFTVSEATTDTNPADSGVVTAVFPETVLTVGDSYGGGIVAYIFVDGDPDYVPGETHGLIAAIDDQSTGIFWHFENAGETGATGILLGTGKANTDKIIALYGAETNAARVCYDYTNLETGTGVYSDWFLPSKEELDKLYSNKDAIDGFAADPYWSSSEGSVGSAWWQYFSDGRQTLAIKVIAVLVRAVRAF